MKLNRFAAMVMLALLVVGAMGVVTLRTFAQTPTPPVTQQAQPPATQNDQSSAEADDAAEAAQGPDIDTLEEQSGPQDESDGGADTETENAAEAENAAGDNEQDTAALGTPAITADVAQATAEQYLNAGTASQVELDDENGQLVYSVEINGTDVKVDAMTGTVLGAESGED